MIGRELVYSTWYGRWQGYKKISQRLNSTTHLHIWDFAHRLGWNVVGLNLDYFYNYPLASWAFPAVSNPCFEHFYTNSNFYARHIAKIRLRFAIWAFSSLRIQICSLKAGFKTRKISSFLPLINTIPTPDDTLKVLCAKYFMLTLMYLLRQYIY